MASFSKEEMVNQITEVEEKEENDLIVIMPVTAPIHISGFFENRDNGCYIYNNDSDLIALVRDGVFVGLKSYVKYKFK